MNCFEVQGADSEALINTALVVNNAIADCAGGEGTGMIGNDTLSVTTITQVEAQLDDILASQAPEAVLGAPISWEEVNGTFPESLADGDFLDETDFMGAVNPDAGITGPE